jgi:hypothetical protein
MQMSDLIPTWPVGFDAWEGFTVLLVLGVLKLTRATVMKSRAQSVDRLGWSILIFDVVLGVFALQLLFRALYPGIPHDLWVGRIATAVVIVVALWQVVEVVTAQPVRIETAMSGPANGYESGSRIGEDRRAPGVPGRRADDYVVRGLDAGPGQERT